MLNRAEKEVNFNTQGHKLLIETYFQDNDICIFTITKYIEQKVSTSNASKRYVTVKRKTHSINSSSLIYQFNQFEDFCNFCDFISKNNNIILKGLFTNSLMYLYKNTYYLVVNGINLSHKSLNTFHSSLLEFSSSLNYIENFTFKLKEHGQILLKNNAISIGIKYFANKT